ncbi:MAG: 30S ribosomal protein S20 [Anaerolineales bacterium]|nr:30S ribosomal protein S20 [Anaerolineales bacterium]
MANTHSAQKRVRSNERKRVYNKISRTRTRSAVRVAREALEDTNPEAARAAVLAAASSLDKAAEKGIIHKNNAARRKSRLMKQLAAVAAPKK